MKMANVGHLHATDGDTEGGVLEVLGFVDGRSFALGNHIGHAYVKSDRMRDLKVMMMVSFCWPQFVPARARRMLRREDDL